VPLAIPPYHAILSSSGTVQTLPQMAPPPRHLPLTINSMVRQQHTLLLATSTNTQSFLTMYHGACCPVSDVRCPMSDGRWPMADGRWLIDRRKQQPAARHPIPSHPITTPLVLWYNRVHRLSAKYASLSTCQQK